MGPTASGKTSLALELADKRDTHLINVDSAQVYRGMDIGSGKLSKAHLDRYPHALLDIRDPSQPYSASDFRSDALAEIASVADSDKLPVLVGGTMLYFKALRDGLAELPTANPAIREEIEQTASESGWDAVHQQLAEVDPESAKRIHPNDPQRLQRALEVFLLTGKSLTEHHREEQAGTDGQTKELPFQPVWFAIQPAERTVLHDRIAQRFRQMLEEGLLEEVKQLYERGDLHPQLPSIKSVGYRQVWQFLDGELDYDGMIERSIIATRQLAKRQLTWLRSWPDLQSLSDSPADSINNSDNILNYVDSISI